MLCRRYISRIVFFLPFVVRLAFSQPAATISGSVRDSDGAAIPGASLRLTARDNTLTLVTSSDSAGQYGFGRLSPGSYLLEASASGFENSGVRPLTVEKTGLLQADFELRIAAMHTTVMVTASGTAQSVDEISKAVSVVDAQSVEMRDEYSVTDALRYVTGLHVQQLGGPGSFVSIKTRGLRSQDTAVTLDGFRLRDAAATQGDATGLLQDLIVTDLDRIEVMRGAGSSLYGTDATGGVVNLITDQGGGRTRGSLLAEGGSLDTFRSRAVLAGSISHERLQYSVGLAHFDTTSGIDGDLPARTSSLQARLDTRLNRETQVFGRIFAVDSFSKLSSSPEAVPNLPAGIIDAVPQVTFTPDADNPDFTRAQRIFAGAVRVSSRPFESLSFSATYQSLLTRRRFGDGPAGQGFQPAGSTLSFYDGDVHTANGRLDWRAGNHQLIDAGYEFEDERYGNRSVQPNPADYSAVDVSQRSHALFAQDQFHFLADRLQLAASYRGQFFSLRQPLLNPAASAPYAGATFSAPPTAQTGDGSAAWYFRKSGTKIRAHAGRGYRAPSLYERFGTSYSSLFGYSAYGNPRLRPERSISLDGGIDQSIGNGRARVSATYFYTRLQEVILFDFLGYLNGGGGLARGVELSGSLTPLRVLNLSAAYTFTNARERTPLADGVLRRFATPDHQFSIVATGRVTPRVTAVFSLLVSSSYLAPLFDPVTFVSRAYRFPGLHGAELSGNYRLPLGERRALRFFARGRNLFNQGYFESGYRTPMITGTGGLDFEF